MSHARDLLGLASKLISLEPGKPKQATLRRAISTAYYALFHLLTQDGARMVAGAQANRAPLRGTLRRAFGHVDMRNAAAGFAAGKLSSKLDGVLLQDDVPDALRRVAAAFTDLQTDRHSADYDLAERFTRSQTADIVASTEAAFTDWQEVRNSEAARVFLVSLLLLKSIRQ